MGVETQKANWGRDAWQRGHTKNIPPEAQRFPGPTITTQIKEGREEGM